MDTPLGVSIFLSSQQGFEEAGLTEGGVKNMPVACFLGPGRIHILMNASGMGVGMRILFVVVECKRIASIVFTKHKRIPTRSGGDSFGFTAGFENQIPAAD